MSTAKLTSLVFPAASCAVSVTESVPGVVALPSAGDCVMLVTSTLSPLTAWLLTAIVQGTIGYVQYSNGLPVGLVALHLAGATVVVGCTAWLWASTTKVSVSAAQALDELAELVEKRREEAPD